MDDKLRRGQVYQILALNDEMLKGGHISREEHDFIRRLQAKKLTSMHGSGTIKAKGNDLM